MTLVKSISLSDNRYKMRIEDLPDEAWQLVQGSRDNSKGKLHSIVRRCINYRKQSVSSIPWKLIDQSGKTVIDNATIDTDQYSELIEFVENIGKIELSLIQTGKAFFYIPDLRVLDPRTITVKWDKDYGIIGYTRKINDSELLIELDDMIYIYEDSIEETGVGESILDTVAIPVKVLTSVDTYISQYFDNGTIKATILTSKENSYPTQEEVDKVESFLNRSIKGLRNAFKSIFLRIPVVATVIGSGLENYDPKLTDAKIMDIITGFEVPPSAVLPSAANYATAFSDKRQYFEIVAIPRLDFIFKACNKQWLKRLGYRLVSEGEKLPIFQEDESQRSQSLSNLVNAGFDVLDAADILGYTIPDEIRNRLIEDRDNPPLPSSFVFPSNQLTDRQLVDQSMSTDETKAYYFS